MAINNVFKNSAGYTLGNLLLKAFSFFLIPLYTTYLSSEEYGIFNLATGFATLLSSIVSLGLQYAVVRFYAEYRNNREKLAVLFSSILVIIVICSILVGSLTYYYQKEISQYFFNQIKFFPIIFLTLLLSILTALYTIYQNILKGMGRASESILLSYFYFAIIFISNIVALSIFKQGVLGVLYSLSLSNLLAVIYMFISLVKSRLITYKFNLPIIRELLLYSMPLLPHSLAFNFQLYITKIILSEKLSMSSLGIYSLSAQFGNISDIILNSVQSAFQPWIFSLLKNNYEDRFDKIKQYTNILMWIYGVCFLGIGLFSQEAIFLASSNEFNSSWRYVPFIVLCIAIKTPMYFYINFLYYDRNKTKYIFYSTIIACVINLVLTYKFVVVWGIMGSIYADIVAMIIRFIIIYIIARKIARSYYSLYEMYLLVLLPMTFMFVGICPSYMFDIITVNLGIVLYKTMIILLYISVAYFVNKKYIVRMAWYNKVLIKCRLKRG